MKIVFFIESLASGGKERRMLELIHYLKENTDYQLYIVLLHDNIHYKYVHDWGIPIEVMERKHTSKDPRIFFKFLISAGK
jgi:hypothetical protein